LNHGGNKDGEPRPLSIHEKNGKEFLEMKRLLTIAGVLLLAVSALKGQVFKVAPSWVHSTDTGLTPVWIHAGPYIKFKFEIYDIYGKLVWDSTGVMNSEGIAKWYGVTNGRRKVQSGQYMLIMTTLDLPGYEGYQQREWIGVTW
jgi:hypothetical protein